MAKEREGHCCCKFLILGAHFGDAKQTCFVFFLHSFPFRSGPVPFLGIFDMVREMDRLCSCCRVAVISRCYDGIISQDLDPTFLQRRGHRWIICYLTATMCEGYQGWSSRCLVSIQRGCSDYSVRAALPPPSPDHRYGRSPASQAPEYSPRRR